MSKLERAKALLDAGALTQDEFEGEKARLLPSPSAHADQSEHRFSGSSKDRGSRTRVLKKAAIVTSIGMSVAAAFYLTFADDAREPPRAPVSISGHTAAPPPMALEGSSAPSKPDFRVEQLAKAPKINVPTLNETDEPSWRVSETALMKQYYDLNEKCRGGSGDDPKTTESCDAREAVSTLLRSGGICYGEEDQAGSEIEFHRCNLRSLARP